MKISNYILIKKIFLGILAQDNEVAIRGILMKHTVLFF